MNIYFHDVDPYSKRKGIMKEEHGRGWKVCIAVTCGILITIVLIAVILAFTLFKPKKLVSKVDSIEIQDMDIGFNVFSMNLNLNVTLNVDVSVKNPNKFGLKYYDGFALLHYRGLQIGEAPIPNGEISPEETKGVNVTLTLMADRLLSNSQIFSDVTSGKLPLNTFMSIAGEVNILSLIKFHVSSTSTCDFSINITNKTIENHVCHYKTKI